MQKIVIWGLLISVLVADAVSDELSKLRELYTITVEELINTADPVMQAEALRPAVVPVVHAASVDIVATLNRKIFNPEYADRSDDELIRSHHLLSSCPAISGANDQRIQERVSGAEDILNKFGLAQGIKLLNSRQYLESADEKNIVRMFDATGSLIAVDDTTSSYPNLAQLTQMDFQALYRLLKSKKTGHYFFVIVSDEQRKTRHARAYARILMLPTESTNKEVIALVLYYCS